MHYSRATDSLIVMSDDGVRQFTGDLALAGYKKTPNAIASSLSPDGKDVLISYSTQKYRNPFAWYEPDSTNRRSGANINTIPITNIAYSHDGSYIITLNAKGKIALRHASQPTMIIKHVASDDDIAALACINNSHRAGLGRFLALRGSGRFLVYDADSMTVAGASTSPPAGTINTTVSHYGTMVAYTTKNNAIIVTETLPPYSTLFQDVIFAETIVHVSFAGLYELFVSLSDGSSWLVDLNTGGRARFPINNVILSCHAY